jgi:hypothetical protein
MASVRIEHRQPQACGTIRYRLTNGWFIDAAKHRAHYSFGHRCGIYKPGAHPSGCAAFLGGADSLKAALALADELQRRADSNLIRMAFGGDYR